MSQADYPDLGRLTPELLTDEAELRLKVFLRDGFACRFLGEYRPTEKLTLWQVEEGTPAFDNMIVVSEKALKVIEESSTSRDKLWPPINRERNTVRCIEFEKSIPDRAALLRAYVTLIESGHRHAAIIYFRLLKTLKGN